MKIKLKPTRIMHLISSSTSSKTTNTTTDFTLHNNLVPYDFNDNELDQTPRNTAKNSASNVSEIEDATKLWNIESALTAALPFTPSSRVGNASITDDHDLPPDFSRASAEFYTPTYQAMKNSTFFTNPNKQRGPNKRLSNASTLYESTILESHDHEVLGLLSSVPEETNVFPRKGMNSTPVSAKCEDFANATPIDCQMKHRPRPFQEFLNEVQSQKRRTELQAPKNESYTSLLRKLRVKEDAIDAWESKERSKAEDQLDKLEMKLEKKRAKAVQRTHRKLVETELEAEKRKAIARRSVLKEMSKLQINS